MKQKQLPAWVGWLKLVSLLVGFGCTLTGLALMYAPLAWLFTGVCGFVLFWYVLPIRGGDGR